MTSEVEVQETNEFLRRRKLRLKQVREQSKDIAKKIRQRAKVERLKQVADLDVQKQKEYFEKQGALVKKLEHLYDKGVTAVGTSHKNAVETRNEELPEKVDLSKLRGREAAAELKRKKQEKLDEQKKLLDRKLQARKTANELSREKSVAIANKLSKKDAEDTQVKSTDNPEDTAKKDSEYVDTNKDKPLMRDMATQRDFEAMPNEWEPNIPTLSLPNEDRESLKEKNCNTESKSEGSKKIDLFALSEEMPISLRGGLTNIEERVPVKPSLTMVSEYLQSRGMRLRETDTTRPSTKRQTDNLQSIRQTILHTRSSKPEVSAKTTKEMTTKYTATDDGLVRKNSVMIYNHSTRDTRDLPAGKEILVIRNDKNEEDAYSQALKESTADDIKDTEHKKKIQDMRNRVAMTKQNIEKEYKDTINFLNSLPKDKNKPIRNAYMNEHRENMQKEVRQRKLQQEYKQIEKECKKHCCTKNRNKSKSPVREIEDDLDSRDFQYSWMPVPESDDNLAIHTIPTTLKEGKANNTVKFSKVDSYHEYRSRHKHTPPTKDTVTREKQSDRKIEAVIIENNSANSTECTSISSGDSSLENVSLKRRTRKSINELSDAERIIIYKILDSKVKRKGKKAKLFKDVTKAPIPLEVAQDGTNTNVRKCGNEAENGVSLDELTEGVHKIVNEKGDNITSMYFSNKHQHNCKKIKVTPDEIQKDPPCCNKVFSQDQQRDQDTNLRWESGEPTSRTQNTCVSCKCGCAGHSNAKDSNKPSVIQPSTATSTSSIKTACNDKSSNALPNCGFIKLLDDGGQEAGKFYIGASGFLNDDAYEVVIQLRKKDGNEKTDDKEFVDNANASENDQNNKILQAAPIENSKKSKKDSVKSIDEIKETFHKPINDINEVSKSCVTANAEMLTPQESCLNTHSSVEQNTNQTDNTQSIEITVDPLNNYNDKGVHTSVPVSNVVPSQVPTIEPPPRTATSHYTQTSINSPNHRPVYFHMSSSTSTAYMSPPEYVLPKFLRQDYHIVDEELCTDNFVVCDEIEISDQQHYSKEYDGCKCKRCIHARKIILSKRKTPLRCKKHSKHAFKKLSTPPNTARTCSTENSFDIYNGKQDETNECCRKRVSQPGALPSNKIQNPNKNQIKAHKEPQLFKEKNYNILNCRNRYKNSNTSRKPSFKPNLNPVIQDYVNKLLSLKKEGVRVVEIANQECSSIATPDSSIVNVSKNIDKTKPTESDISLEKIRSILKLQILEEYIKKKQEGVKCSVPCGKNSFRKNTKLRPNSRKKQVHKVKSLNISKNILKTTHSSSDSKQSVNNNTPSLSSPNEKSNQPEIIIEGKKKYRSKSSPTPRRIETKGFSNILKFKNVNLNEENINIDNLKIKNDHLKTTVPQERNKYVYPNHHATITNTTSISTDSDNGFISKMQNSKMEIPITISTQTSQNIDKEINYIKLAEDKLQNMEKIADLTEKCTKRLSNLARVLDEVRRNKSLAYSQISTSDSASDSDQKSDKNTREIKSPAQLNDLILETQKKPEGHSPISNATTEIEVVNNHSTDFVPFLTDIPKPNNFKSTDSYIDLPQASSISSNHNIQLVNKENCTGKNRTKPPAALSRIHLKNSTEHIIPHELSTVLEVDSPMSNKFRTPSSRGTKEDETDSTPTSIKAMKTSNENGRYITEEKELCNPDLLQSNINTQQSNILLSESSDDSKLQMMDLNQFNEIMLKPFITFKEHAKQCNILVDEGSNIDDNNKGTGTDEISSLHSDGSLPDVIAELLKRNIISEPFKYETASNVNSTTISSESTLSILALSKVRRDKRNSGVTYHNKENIGETSDSLSLSSNPDLENAFKKLGMGWASSTLKKTKERLALSSSSNTSSTSLSQFKLKSSNNQDIPALVTDSISTILNISKKPGKGKNINDNKNVEQQTSLTNSMTVKEFLTNELANKITFTNKSHRNDTEEEFVSLFETKMPENMKDVSQTIREECSGESARSTNNNNRARTSTPVQVFKSTTYHSSSSSNLSNGLFSNVDDLSSVKVTSNSVKNHSTSDKDDLTVPNFSLRLKKSLSDCSKSE